MRALFVATLSALLAALLSTSGDFTSARLTTPPTTGWPTNGGNLYNQRYSPLTAINRVNVVVVVASC